MERLLQFEREEGDLASYEAAREKCAAQLKRVKERREKVRLGCLMERKRVSAIELTPCYLRPLARNVPRSSRERKRGGKR